MRQYSVTVRRWLRWRAAAAIYVLYARKRPAAFFSYVVVALCALAVGIWQAGSETPFFARGIAVGLWVIAVVSLVICLPVAFAILVRSFALDMPIGARQTLRFDAEGFTSRWSGDDNVVSVFFAEVDSLFSVMGMVLLTKRGAAGYLMYPMEVFPLAEQIEARRRASESHSLLG